MTDLTAILAPLTREQLCDVIAELSTERRELRAALHRVVSAGYIRRKPDAPPAIEPRHSLPERDPTKTGMPT